MKKKISGNSGHNFNESMCWRCRRVSCQWMKKFMPVDGWTADRYDFLTDEGHIVDSYFVRECPKFSKTDL